MHQLVTPSSLLHLPSVGRSIAKPLATDLSANELLGMGWIKFRAGRTLECHLGGTPLVLGGQDVLQSSEQNAAVVQMFLGASAPQPAPRASSTPPAARSTNDEPPGPDPGRGLAPRLEIFVAATDPGADRQAAGDPVHAEDPQIEGGDRGIQRVRGCDRERGVPQPKAGGGEDH